jgi:hypothetical protein
LARILDVVNTGGLDFNVLEPCGRELVDIIRIGECPVDEGAVATAAIADPVKETTPEAIRSLKELGVRIVMLTGDAQQTADAVARELGIDIAIGDVLPADKANHVKRLQAEGHKVAMEATASTMRRRSRIIFRNYIQCLMFDQMRAIPGSVGRRTRRLPEPACLRLWSDI